jgi:16S rRNA (uracil1498-N3)-methyltransferase
MRRFYIEDSRIGGETADIRGLEARHIKTVLRMKPGDHVELVDGSGFAFEAQIRQIASERVLADIVQRYPVITEPDIQLTVALGFLKEKKMDLLVRHLTEIGITRLIPVFSERSIPRPEKQKIASRLTRWGSISREAVKQSRRGFLPVIEEPAGYERILEISSEADVRLLFWEEAREPMAAPREPRRSGASVFALLGPEGGFSKMEAEKAVEAGFSSVTLGPRVLRAETAAIAACALIQYLFGDMGEKTP